jgi:hypothetical protein
MGDCIEDKKQSAQFDLIPAEESNFNGSILYCEKCDIILSYTCGVCKEYHRDYTILPSKNLILCCYCSHFSSLRRDSCLCGSNIEISVEEWKKLTNNDILRYWETLTKNFPELTDSELEKLEKEKIKLMELEKKKLQEDREKLINDIH